MLTLLFAVPLSVGVRFVDVFISERPKGYATSPPQIVDLGSCVFWMIATIALVQFIRGAVALAKKPSADSNTGLQIGLCVFAFVPVVNLIVFPLLLCLYTRSVGIDLGKRPVVRSAWMLLGCSLVLVPPVVFAANWVLASALDPTPARPAITTPDPVAAEVLFGVAAGAVLWLGAYIVSMMILSGVPRAIEKRLREYATPDDLVPDLEVDGSKTLT